MNLSDRHKQVIQLISVGRSSLDHFVDTLAVDCQFARSLAEDLVASMHIRPKGSYFTDAVTYVLTDLGNRTASTLLRDRSAKATSLDILDDEWSVVSLLSERPVARRVLEAELPTIAPGAMQSILVHLQDLGLVKISGFFQVYASLTTNASRRLA